ncbi:MAG TPA: PxKF domain-containing protein, partial [Anaerolineales bacterium]|nr:PxKF domain-containing protein [Anaerolineales bacterium]
HSRKYLDMTSTTKRFRTRTATGIMLVLIIIAALVTIPSARAAGNHVTLDFNSLPSAQGWTYIDGGSGVPEASAFSVDGDMLHMDTIGVGNTGIVYQLFGAVDPALPFTLTVRARVNEYEEANPSLNNPHGFDIDVYTGSEQYEVGISPKRILAGAPPYLEITAVDVTQFHDYRIESNGGGSFELFIDDVSVGTALTTISAGQNSLYFGDATAGANANVDISYYSFTQVPDYTFSGFFQPVDNLPVLNTVNAGRAIPVKFSLGGDQGLDIFAPGYPSSTVIACGSTAGDAVEQTVTAGSSSLSYDSSTDQYTYVWKTEKAWAGTCRTLVVKLNDGTFHWANFKFK